MRKTLTILLIAHSFTAYSAENAIYMIGGGGEPTGAATTQFDESVRAMGQFFKLNKRKYDATISFNGGHRETEDIIRTDWEYEGARVNKNFTKSNYEKTIQEMKDKLNKNPPEIPENGKLLLFINTHGGEKSGNTHRISLVESPMTNMNSGSDDMVSLDSLQELIDLAEAKKVKLAIVDGSCHSGNTLALKGPKACIISGSGPNHYAYSSFADTFAHNMFFGRSLEEVFQITRDAMLGEGFPMISTPEGIETQDKLYPLLTPFMYYHDEYRGMQLDKIDNYLASIKTNEMMCQREVQYSELQNVLTLIEDVNTITRKPWWSSKVIVEKQVDLNSLKEKIAAYKKTQDEYIDKFRKLNIDGYDKIEKVTSTALENYFTRREIVSTDYDALIATKTAELRLAPLTEADQKNTIRLRDFYEEAKRVQQRIIKENPDYGIYKTLVAGLKTDEKVNRTVASEINKEAHIAYNAYYKAKQKEILSKDPKASNPCKDFVL